MGRGGSPRFALRSSPRYIFRAETVRCATGHRSQIHTPFGPCSKDRDKDYLFPVSRKYIFIGIRTRWDPTSCSFVLFFRGLLIFTISLRYYRRREERRISNRLLIVNFPPMCKEMEQGTVAHRRLGMKAISKPRHVDERLMKIIFISFRLFTSFL